MSVRPRDVVVARDAVWRVLAVEQGDACRAVRLERLDPPPRGLTRTFVEPFDVVQTRRGDGSWRVASRGAVMARVRELIAEDRRWSEPLSVVGLPIAIPPWQLVPAMTILSGRARRTLVADAVGLGKTIQAGLLIRELVARDPARRVLVLLPAGLRSQWQAELRRHFDIEAEIGDLAWLERRARDLPPDVNPWARSSVVLSSLDFAKRDEVLPGPQDTTWDLVVVDEAHAVGDGTARAQLVDAVCRRARSVVLLTATPHAGQSAGFEAVCRLGSVAGEPPLIIVRRQRHDVGAGRAAPRWRLLHASPTLDEQHAARLLERYLAALERQAESREPAAVRLLMQVLRKRAASGAAALARTARRRRDLLVDPLSPSHRQAGLPFDVHAAAANDEVPDDVLGARGLDRMDVERAWLGALIHAADRAARSDSRLTLLRRLLRRVREPVIVFTEYRDTLAYLARRLAAPDAVELLHGGLSTRERDAAVDRFRIGATRLLLATDAASEGLNLQARCRCVVMWDLPWTPTRLDQRVGRLDRIGQRRRVHVVVLVQRGATFDAGLLARLHDRRGRIEEALAPATTMAPDAVADADIAARRFRLRALVRAAHRGADRRPSPPCSTERCGPVAPGIPVTCLEPNRSRCWSGALVLVDGQLDCGREVVDRALLVVHVPLHVPRLATRADVRRYLRHHAGLAAAGVAGARTWLAPRWQESTRQWHAFSAAGAACSAPVPGVRRAPVLRQHSLFGRYAERMGGSFGSQPSASGRTTGGDGEVALADRIEVAAVILAPGDGRIHLDHEGGDAR